ncbi:HlyD family efflux transporter periplasmic adaptor subunit [Spirulina sp. 06S082]|uniref:HlyD family efflux transporter periplasmic adaptor subunit n=1 Tax=Spirulina sp. 06S082 TaxID=3110248 RepID=UPI002B20EC21|nr:HlyD family efflux transporter periplasmic adaptor subunit [Spirulina sp. 06S082]MEA5467814.1 HlyD family efflux transporter periplasmic adaptor subunit [Spirulina sp. 06S082]
MKSSFSASPPQARQTKEQFAHPEDYLSFELGKAVQELPPLYSRLLAGTISLLVFSAIAWAHYSKIDEVAVSQGELIASVHVRPVRSLKEGIISEVKVKEGDKVKKGSVLIQRDSVLPQADIDRLTNSMKLIEQDIARLSAESQGNVTSGTPLQDRLSLARLQDFESRRVTAIAQAKRQQAAIESAKVRQVRLQENLVNAQENLVNAKVSWENSQKLIAQSQERLQLAQERVSSLAILAEQGIIPRLDYLEARERVARAEAEVTQAQNELTQASDRITDAKNKADSLVKDIEGQEQEIRQTEQAYRAAIGQAQRLGAERQSEILTQLNQRKEELTAAKGQLEKVKKERTGETIIAPAAGTVYNLKATLGPVQTGEELLSIVSQDENLFLEAKVLNRDIGFIAPGMKVKVKMATFPFQEFGTVDGEVVNISPNAITDEQLGLVFPTRIDLFQYSKMVRGQEVVFTPGMAATAEIVTRKKSILTFLIEPITRRFNQAFSVR